MAKKYKKIGQADIYQEQKPNGCLQFIGWIVAFLIVIIAAKSCS